MFVEKGSLYRLGEVEQGEDGQGLIEFFHEERKR